MTFSLDWLARKLSGAARLRLPALELQASVAVPGFSLGPQTHTILFPEPALIPTESCPQFHKWLCGSQFASELVEHTVHS